MYPAFRLARFRQFARKAWLERNLNHVLDALAQQTRFWQFAGAFLVFVLVAFGISFLSSLIR